MGFEVRRQETASKTIRLPVELIREMEQLADRAGVSFNQLVIQCCTYALANLEQPEEDSR